MMELSKRLQAVANLVTPGMRLVDVGTDHGYIPIYLVEQKVIPAAIAMDVNKGPLKRAQEHIREYHLEDKITTRLSDGLKNLKKEEADSMIAAGMGGGLVIRILSEGREIAHTLKELILQPQSELGKVRGFLWKEGYQIVEEDMVIEEGKYYPMMRVVKASNGGKRPYQQEELEYGRLLLEKAHPVLEQYLVKEIEVQEGILSELCMQNSLRAMERAQQVKYKIEWITEIHRTYFKK